MTVVMKLPSPRSQKNATGDVPCRVYCNALATALELAILWSAREGDDIADVLHTRNKQDEALETETETCMRA